MSNPERTLTKNKISSFIIRIDIDMSGKLDYNKINERLLQLFPNQEIQIMPHFNVNLDNVTIERAETKKFIFKLEDRVRLEISPIDKAIIFTSGYYTTNDIYKERIEKIIDVFAEITERKLNSRRIGMRYINTFSSVKDGNLPGVLNLSETKILKESLSKKEDLSRLIVVDEYLKDDYRIRVQYGVPNKFYPNKISTQDVILDIDVYSEGLQPIERWGDIIRTFNHAAFDTFRSYLRDEVFESLK